MQEVPIVSLILSEHNMIYAMVNHYERVSDAKKNAILRDLAESIKEHALLEESILFPYIPDTALVEHLTAEHRAAGKDLLDDVLGRHQFLETLKEIRGHFDDEENRMFAALRALPRHRTDAMYSAWVAKRREILATL